FGQEGKIKKLEQTFLSRLNVLATTSCKDKITYVGGLGTMISFEVGSSSKQDTDKFLNKLFENGIVAYSAGRNPSRVRFLLPLCLTEKHIDEIFAIIEKTIKELF
ncbi:MAG: aminotransferase class III-fold pyridoxal phosphate-dependent enzyme, partial [Bacteriovoracaceae bacterium]|nr:aminotransferase class III-fold pyridoxal phosphate-dependent enzyme [Bacteriovoracaceae bacterium]